MQPYAPDRMVRALTTLVSLVYWAGVIGSAFVLVTVVAVRALFPGDRALVWSVPVRALAPGVADSVVTPWGVSPLQLAAGDAELVLPFALLPWWMVAVVLLYVALMFLPPLVALHQLRRIFQRAREGAPFDARNAVRLWWVGVALIATAAAETLSELVTALAMRAAHRAGQIEILAPGVNFTLLLVGLAVIALAEVFRRGAELEDEQSLVV